MPPDVTQTPTAIRPPPPNVSFTSQIPEQNKAEAIDVQIMDYAIAATAQHFNNQSLNVQDTVGLALGIAKLIKERRDIAGLRCGTKGSSSAGVHAHPID